MHFWIQNDPPPALWHFSENSSVLVAGPFPKLVFQAVTPDTMSVVIGEHNIEDDNRNDPKRYGKSKKVATLAISFLGDKPTISEGGFTILTIGCIDHKQNFSLTLLPLN